MIEISMAINFIVKGLLNKIPCRLIAKLSITSPTQYYANANLITTIVLNNAVRLRWHEAIGREEERKKKVILIVGDIGKKRERERRKKTERTRKLTR